MVAAGVWAILAAGVGLGWLFGGQGLSPLTIEHTLEAARPGLLLWRVALFGVLIGFWPVWIDVIGHGWHLTEPQRVRLAGARWTLAEWLVVLELELGQNIGGRFLNLLVRLTS
jgi:hypothetical protein